MHQFHIINKNTILLFFASLIINLVFFLNYHQKSNYSMGLILGHGELGYNVYRYNSLKINPERQSFIFQKQINENRIVDYTEIDHTQYGLPTQNRPVQDTFGYGLLLGFLWKLTGVTSYVVIEILQILLFSLLFFLFYSLAFMIFKDERIALWCSIAHLFFLPLYYLNINPVRDIWAYYGVLVLLWVIVAYIFYNYSWWILFGGSIFFTLCQLMRAMMVCNVAMGLFVILCAAMFKWIAFNKAIKAITVVALANILFFWIPFCTYNKYTFDRYFVGPTGQWLVEGMGEFENQWGFQLDDGWFGTYMMERYGLRCGTPQCDEQAKQLFFECLKEDPRPFIKSIYKRLAQIVLPGLAWNDYYNVWYKVKYHSMWQKIKAHLKYPFTSMGAFYDFFGRQIYIRLFLLLGYLGLFLLLWRRQYFFAVLIFGVGILPSYSCIPSHIEYRYIIPYYSFFSLGTGYAVIQIRDFVKRKRYFSWKV